MKNSITARVASLSAAAAVAVTMIGGAVAAPAHAATGQKGASSAPASVNFYAPAAKRPVVVAGVKMRGCKPLPATIAADFTSLSGTAVTIKKTRKVMFVSGDSLKQRVLRKGAKVCLWKAGAPGAAPNGSSTGPSGGSSTQPTSGGSSSIEAVSADLPFIAPAVSHIRTYAALQANGKYAMVHEFSLSGGTYKVANSSVVGASSTEPGDRLVQGETITVRAIAALTGLKDQSWSWKPGDACGSPSVVAEIRSPNASSPVGLATYPGAGQQVTNGSFMTLDLRTTNPAQYSALRQPSAATPCSVQG